MSCAQVLTDPSKKSWEKKSEQPTLPEVDQRLTGVTKVCDNRWTYEIDFNLMEQTNLETGTTRKVRRFGMEFEGLNMSKLELDDGTVIGWDKWKSESVGHVMAAGGGVQS